MTIEQLRELLEQLRTDPGSVTDEQLAAGRQYIAEQRQHLAEQPASPDVITALTELKDSRQAIGSVQDERSAAAAELDQQRQGLLDELGDDNSQGAEEGASTGGESGDQGGDAGEGGTGSDITGGGDGGDAGAPEGDAGAQGGQGGEVAVAASARRAPVGTFRAPAARPRANPELTARTRVTAAGGSPGFVQGQPINSTAELAMAFTERIRALASGKGTGSGEKIYVASGVTEYPEARTLRAADWVGNFSKIEGAVGDQALVAAGGLCAPLQVLYDIDVIGSSRRPIRDALAPFGVDRGGIRFRPHSSAASALLGGEGTGVDRWTLAQDASTVDRKGCYVVACPGIEEAVIQSIYLCLEFKNITARYDPESTAANIREGVIAHARLAENELLRQLQETSKVLSAPKVVGATRDILANIDKATAYYRNRHRLDTDLSLTAILPAWVRYLMRTDIARQMAAGDWTEALGVTDAMIARWFSERGVNPVWHLDGQGGGTAEVQTVTVTGTPTSGGYTLTFDGETTGNIPFNAVIADVKAALEDLPNIDIGDVAVAGGPHPGTAITVAFGGGYQGTNVPQMTATGSLGGGSTPAVAVTTTTPPSSTSVVNGVSIASQVYDDAAAGAVIPGYPDQIDALLFASGTKLFLDGGSLDLGLVRDSELNSRNAYRSFSETFEGVADRGVENLRLVMTCQPTGQTAGTADTSAIAD